MKVIITAILGFFGYVKIPVAAVQLSLLSEAYFDRIYADIPEEYRHQRERFKRYVDGQKKLTEFLRAGRKLKGF